MQPAEMIGTDGNKNVATMAVGDDMALGAETAEPGGSSKVCLHQHGRPTKTPLPIPEDQLDGRSEQWESV